MVAQQDISFQAVPTLYFVKGNIFVVFKQIWKQDLKNKLKENKNKNMPKNLDKPL